MAGCRLWWIKVRPTTVAGWWSNSRSGWQGHLRGAARKRATEKRRVGSRSGTKTGIRWTVAPGKTTTCVFRGWLGIKLVNGKLGRRLRTKSGEDEHEEERTAPPEPGEIKVGEVGESGSHRLLNQRHR